MIRIYDMLKENFARREEYEKKNSELLPGCDHDIQSVCSKRASSNGGRYEN